MTAHDFISDSSHPRWVSMKIGLWFGIVVLLLLVEHFFKTTLSAYQASAQEAFSNCVLKAIELFLAASGHCLAR